VEGSGTFLVLKVGEASKLGIHGNIEDVAEDWERDKSDSGFPSYVYASPH
jgi:hypothetical protein